MLNWMMFIESIELLLASKKHFCLKKKTLEEQTFSSKQFSLANVSVTCLPESAARSSHAQKQKSERNENSLGFALNTLLKILIKPAWRTKERFKTHDTRAGLCLTRVNTFGIKLFAACIERSGRPQRHESSELIKGTGRRRLL